MVVVGNVSSSKLVKTKMAKSVLDAGWFMLKTQLSYKAKGQKVEFLEVNEAYGPVLFVLWEYPRQQSER